MARSELDRLMRPHLDRDEKLRAAVSGYTGLGFSRIILGVTDDRVLAVKSGYWSLTDKGLGWADPLDEVALGELPQEVRTKGAYTGNTYIRVRRADGSTLRLNPRNGFAGDHEGTRRNVDALYAAVPGRF
ncbi:hypothetical protein DVA86_23195 [Streptomyces armeniacus]|uniref:Uncharacterized protein n=1 Tax=Streptomyces armeniacus TaxID=83291 RepID=A0A345XU04_9ACTN|nr:hypothetical protein [Streptomyces armeniacus]AXK35120.1 hypothetical protein DVA86_23195 [Streptomyces armeniacus]